MATIDMGQKVGAAVGPGPLSVGGARSPCNTVAWAEAYLHTKCHPDPFNRLATIIIIIIIIRFVKRQNVKRLPWAEKRGPLCPFCGSWDPV